jgi:hypothetical protein
MAEPEIPVGEVDGDAVWDDHPIRQRRNAVKEMLTEQRELLDKQPKMWADRNKVRTPVGKVVMRDKLNRSGFDDRLAWIGGTGFGGYYIQNRKIWKGKTKQVQLADVPEIGFDRKGEKLELRKMIAQALAVLDADILASDRLRCKVCVEFRGKTDMELMAHFSKKHPEELSQLAEGFEKMEQEDAEEQDQEPPPPPARRPKQTYART